MSEQSDISTWRLLFRHLALLSKLSLLLLHDCLSYNLITIFDSNFTTFLPNRWAPNILITLTIISVVSSTQKILLQWNLCNPTPEFSNILWHPTKIYGSNVILLTKIKREYWVFLQFWQMMTLVVPLVLKLIHLLL
jgi:hypothetical protein